MCACMCVYVCVRIYPYPLILYFNIRVQQYKVRHGRVGIEVLHVENNDGATWMQRATDNSGERGRVAIGQFVYLECSYYCAAHPHTLLLKSEV
jgi:hypothetical protein